jgi:hypothetical protein
VTCRSSETSFERSLLVPVAVSWPSLQHDSELLKERIAVATQLSVTQKLRVVRTSMHNWAVAA